MPAKPGNSIEQFAQWAAYAESPQSINTLLGMVEPHLPRFGRFRLYLLYHQGDIFDSVVGQLRRWAFLRPEMVNPKTHSISAQYVAPKPESHPERGVFALLPSSQPDIHRLAAVSLSDFWYRAVRRFVSRAYPLAMPVFFKQSEMYEALKTFEAGFQSGFRIRIIESTFKGIREPNRPQESRRFDTDRVWRDQTIDEAFDECREQNKWFKSITYRIMIRKGDSDRYKPVGTGRIYKNGHISYDGYHLQVTNILLPLLERRASDRLRLLRNRGRMDRNYEPGAPIEISYGSDVFGDVSEVQRFGRVIDGYPNATKAVYHANPYYHASIADFLEGSSFEIWILSSRQILLIPQAQSTEQAYERLISHIFTEFREGTIGEYHT